MVNHNHPVKKLSQREKCDVKNRLDFSDEEQDNLPCCSTTNLIDNVQKILISSIPPNTTVDYIALTNENKYLRTNLTP